MASILFPGKLDHKIQKDATSKVPSSFRSGTRNTSNVSVPTIVVHIGSYTIPCRSAKVPSLTGGSTKSTIEEKDSKTHKMSLGDEPVVNQHGPTMNNVNCLPVPPPVSPPAKQNSLNAVLTSGSRNLTKSNSVPSRSKMDRNLSKQESFETDSGMTPTVQRSRGNPKVKLLQRSHAVREETSPPRVMELAHLSPNTSNDKLTVNKTVNGVSNNNNNNNNNTNNNNHVNSNSNSSNINNNTKAGNMVPQTGTPGYQGGHSLQLTNNLSRPSSRHKLRHQGSSQGSMDNSSPCLSRESSTEQYTDNSGIDLNQFLADTLNRNYKDRMLLLQIEQDLLALIREPKRAYQKFPVMSSYQRMLVHRVAAFFGMDHNVDQTGNCVVVSMTPSTRIPDIRFSELLRDDYRFPEEPRRCILKRDSSSFEEGMQFRSPERQLSGDSRRSKSFEEREEEYERARKRIFNRDDGFTMASFRSYEAYCRRSSHEDLRWHGEPWSISDSDIWSARGRQSSALRMNRMSKVESFEGNDTLKANSLKGSVSKSYSFGGYPGMTRGDSVSSCSSRALIKQDSVTSSVSSARLSPSSSGYKSQSVRSDATASTTPSPNQATSQGSFSPEPNTVVWAVSSLTAVPTGAVLINPTSGQPYTNADGSLYRYDPDNPIKLCPTIEEDVAANALSSPNSGTIASSNDTPNLVIKDNVTIDNSVNPINSESTGTEFTEDKSAAVLINSSTSPSLPNLSQNEAVPTKDNNSQYLESGRIESNKKYDRPAPYLDDTSQANSNSGQIYSNTMETMPVEVAQTNFSGIESENNVYNDNAGNSSVNSATNVQGDAREYSGRNNSISYQLNYGTNSGVQSGSEYGSQPASNGEYLNSSVGVTPINYAIGPPYSAEAVHMPPEMLYSSTVVYASGQQTASFGVVQGSPAATTAGPVPPTPPPLPPPTAGAATSAPASAYESRPTEGNQNVAVSELGNYFMGLNVGNEQIPPAGTPAPQLGYWGPSPNTSQTQGSNHSQIQMYYLPGSLPAGTFHPKYSPTTPSMYSYNVPPVVYPTAELCQSMIPSTANAVFPAQYYAPAGNTTMSYRAPTPPTPSAVAATAMTPSFFVYHPQTSAPPPPPIQFGMVRHQQQVPGIRSSPPPGPRGRMPYNRQLSERGRHGSLNLDPKTTNLHYSSLSMYGLRYMSGDIPSVGMMRPLANVRAAAAAANSNGGHHSGSHSSGNDSILTASRPPRPRKQR